MGSTPMLLVTANVGSIFEDPSVMLKLWTEEFLSTVTRLDPKFVGVHCQEVGGKNYEQSMQHVEFFVKLLMSSEELRLFDKVRIFLDEDFSSAENFTALGNFYFIHKSITDILIWDFKDLNFVSVEGHSVYSGNIEHVPTKEKSKFPQDFFPECKWSRKGFLRTRWNLQGTVLDLVNIHLFHDASNFVAMETFPSVYSKTRQRALEYTLERFATDENGAAPFFLFGDFNFRTDTQGVIKKLGDGLDLHRIQNAKNVDSMTLEYRDDSNEVVMVLGKKEFSHLKHENIFLESPGVWLKEFDREIDVFAGRLFEFPISFPPSYPFEEDPCLASAAHSYMKTRCPAWCDRVVLGLTAKALVHDMSSENSTEYNLIGLDTCMGDHKPVYLKFNLKNHEGIVRIAPSSSCSSPSSPPLTTPPPPALAKFRSCSVDIEDPSSVVPSSAPGVNGVPRVDSPKSLKNIPVKQISFDDSMNLKGSKSSLSSVGLQFSIDPGLVDNNHTGSNASSRKSSIKSILIDKIKIVKRVNSESECACVSPQGQQASQSWRTRSVSLASSNISAAGNANNPQHVFVRSISKLKLRNDSLDTSHTSQISLPRLESHHSSSDEDWFEQVEEKITAIAGAGNGQDSKNRKISRTSRGSLEERESAGGFGSTSCFRMGKTSSAAGDDSQSPPYRATASYVKPATAKTRPASSKLSNIMNVLKKQQRNSIIREEDVEKLAEKMGGSSRSEKLSSSKSEKLGSSKSEKLGSSKSEKLGSSRSEKLSGSTSLNDKDNNGTENEEREKLKIREKSEEKEEEEEDMKEGDEEVGEELLEGKKRKKKKKKKKKRKKKDGEQEEEEDRERRKYCIPCCRVS